MLIDWDWPSAAPGCVDLASYLAVTCDRLSKSKEDVMAAYRDALDRRAIATGRWWDRQLDRQLDPAPLGGFLQLGWSKEGDELAWWAERSPATARELSGRTPI